MFNNSFTHSGATYLNRFAFAVSLALGMLASSVSQAQTVQITVENLGVTGGLFLTPVWVGLHDGTFDFFDAGTMSSPSLESLAEGGVTTGLEADFAGMGVDTVIAPGTPFGPASSSFANSASATLTGLNTSANRYLSFASMIIPSNDAFIGNGSPTTYEIFDAGGNFTGPLTITVTGADVWDSGTEVNDTMGAAFSTLPGIDSSEALNIATHSGLNNFINSGTMNGETITSAFVAGTPLARITITPEPTGLLMAQLALLATWISSRRRARKDT